MRDFLRARTESSPAAGGGRERSNSNTMGDRPPRLMEISPRNGSTTPKVSSYAAQTSVCLASLFMRNANIRGLSQSSSSPATLVGRSWPEGTLWINVVDKELATSLSAQERKRQEVIFELISTERRYVEDVAMILNVRFLPLLAFALLFAAFADLSA